MSKYDEKRAINDIRLLALDMINEAGSGHPGIALGVAPILYTLFKNHLNFDLERKDWINRDRFVLSAGHGSALLYATLFYLTDDYNMVDLRNFRKLDSMTPGHPEYDINHRIETTTGPLGQGFANAVGMAMASKYLGSIYNDKNATLFDNYVYVLCGDGDLMEGISYEAASLAGNLELDNLIVLYDSNNVSLDGNISKTFTDDIGGRFLSQGWNVLAVKDGEKIKDIDKAINAAKKSDSPTLIIINTTIGKYSKYENTNKIHGKLEKEDLEGIREKLGWQGDFMYDKDNMLMCRALVKNRVSSLYASWYSEYETFVNNNEDEEVEKLNAIINNEKIALQLDKVIDTSKLFVDKSLRDINYQIMNVISAFVPNFVGGSADLVNSTKTYLKNKEDFSSDNYSGKNIFYGVREHAMGAISNGLALSNLRPFASTFLVFSDYLKPSIRLSAMMNLPVTYIFTHDTFLIGEDGATHQPIEQLGALRTIPNLHVFRPADHKELIGAWNFILRSGKPSVLILSKYHVPALEFTSADEVRNGAYIVSEVKNALDVILIATGSEVALAMKVKEELLRNYIEARVVSMPNVELFLKQEESYKEQILPKGYRKIVIEFSNDPNMYRFVNNDTDLINIRTFGKSGNKEELSLDYELDIASIVIKIKNLL